MLRVFDIFNLYTKDFDLVKSPLCICFEVVIIFTTETLPIQICLDDSYVSLFSNQEEDEENESSNRIEEAKSEMQRSIRSVSSGTQSVPEAKISLEEEKTFPTSHGTESVHDMSKVVVETGKKRIAFKEYAATNMSVDAIRKRIKGRIIASQQFKLQAAFSSASHKLGKIFDADLDLGGGNVKKVAIRIIEFSKLPSYLIEDLYLECCYRVENTFEALVPLLGISCEPPKLYLLMPKYALSLHQYIYEKSATNQERAKIIR